MILFNLSSPPGFFFGSFADFFDERQNRAGLFAPVLADVAAQTNKRDRQQPRPAEQTGGQNCRGDCSDQDICHFRASYVVLSEVYIGFLFFQVKITEKAAFLLSVSAFLAFTLFSVRRIYLRTQRNGRRVKTMPGAASIMAGMAFVKITMDNAELKRGLDDAQSRQRIGAGIDGPGRSLENGGPGRPDRGRNDHRRKRRPRRAGHPVIIAANFCFKCCVISVPLLFINDLLYLNSLKKF